jgi:DNA-binding response OmpR family regulator
MTLEKRILIVDDDDAIRALLRTVLRRRGFVVDTARDGLEALEEIAERRYALIILDLMMPHMNGYELVRNLEEQSFTSRPRVLILTAGLQSSSFLSDLIVGSLPKPFDIDLLLSTVTGCLDETAALRQPEPGPASSAGEESRPN